MKIKNTALQPGVISRRYEFTLNAQVTDINDEELVLETFEHLETQTFVGHYLQWTKDEKVVPTKGLSDKLPFYFRKPSNIIARCMGVCACIQRVIGNHGLHVWKEDFSGIHCKTWLECLGIKIVDKKTMDPLIFDPPLKDDQQ